MNNKNANELLNKIDKNYEQMSKGQKLLADYILKNYDKAVFLTAAKTWGKWWGSVSLLLSDLQRSWGIKGIRDFRKH